MDILYYYVNTLWTVWLDLYEPTKTATIREFITHENLEITPLSEILNALGCHLGYFAWFSPWQTKARKTDQVQKFDEKREFSATDSHRSSPTLEQKTSFYHLSVYSKIVQASSSIYKRPPTTTDAVLRLTAPTGAASYPDDRTITAVVELQSTGVHRHDKQWPWPLWLCPAAALCSLWGHGRGLLGITSFLCIRSKNGLG